MPTKPLPADLVPSTRRILRVYRGLTPEQIADGMVWYQVAHELALALDPGNVLRAAGVISAYSPQNPWSKNVQMARLAYEGIITEHLNQTSKVERIMAGEDVVTVLNGLKTVNFALTITDPCDPHAVVVDRHAFDIAVGRVTSDRERGVLDRKGVYDQFADAYRRAARIIGISPSHMQACTWVGWRETMIRTAEAVKREAGRAAA